VTPGGSNVGESVSFAVEDGLRVCARLVLPANARACYVLAHGPAHARASLSLIEDADHAFHVPAHTGRNDAEVRAALLRAVAAWMDSLL
jgi:hypothetical protein